MNVAELKELLDAVDDDVEVRLAQQPSWPFEYSVGEAFEASGSNEMEELEEETKQLREELGMALRMKEEGKEYLSAEDIVATNDRLKELAEKMIEAEEKMTRVFYIGEGTQLGYLPKFATDELGW